MPVTTTLYERVQTGDQASIGEFLSRYGDMVWSLACRHCRHPEDARKCTSDFFVESWTKAGRFPPSHSSEITWICMFTRRWNRAITDDHARSEHGTTEVSASLAENIDQILLIDRDARIARQCLDELPREEVTLVEYVITGHTTPEILANQLRISVATAHGHLRRVIVRVQDRLTLGASGQSDRAAFDRQQRLCDLLAGWALRHITVDELGELHELEESTPQFRANFERAVAATELALKGSGTRTIPSQLRSQILLEARVHLPLTDQFRPGESRPLLDPSAVPEVIPWSKANLGVLITVVAFVVIAARLWMI